MNVLRRFSKQSKRTYYVYEDYVLVGTKGYTLEGLFYLDRRGRLTGWDEANEEHTKKLINREITRL